MYIYIYICTYNTYVYIYDYVCICIRYIWLLYMYGLTWLVTKWVLNVSICVSRCGSGDFHTRRVGSGRCRTISDRTLSGRPGGALLVVPKKAMVVMGDASNGGFQQNGATKWMIYNIWTILLTYYIHGFGGTPISGNLQIATTEDYRMIGSNTMSWALSRVATRSVVQWDSLWVIKMAGKSL